MNPADAWPEPQMQQRARPAGFSLLELALVLIVAGVLATVAMGRYLYYQERAEKIAMESTLVWIKMGVQMRLAELMMTNRQSLAAQLERENPVQWLKDEPPVGYRGVYSASATRGHWYYAPVEHELVYLPTATTYLETAQTTLPELRFRVVIRFEQDALTGQPAPIGVSLVPSRDFKWF